MRANVEKDQVDSRERRSRSSSLRNYYKQILRSKITCKLRSMFVKQEDQNTFITFNINSQSSTEAINKEHETMIPKFTILILMFFFACFLIFNKYSW